MSLAHGILGFLSYGEMSGYDLSKAFSASVQFFWNAQNSQIYLMLDKLEKQNYVTHKLVVQTDKPNKKIYSITKLGKNEFIRWLSDNNKKTSIEFKNTFLMRVFFSGNVSPQQSITMLQGFVRDCKIYMETMTSIPQSIEQYSREVSGYSSLYWEFTAEFGREYLTMCINWAERCIQRLEELD